MKPDWSWRRSQRVIFDCLAALLMVAGAAIVTAQLRHIFPALPNSLFFCAVILSAWRGGLGAGLLASVLSSTFIIFWLPPPSLTGPNPGSEVPRFLVFLLVSFFISWICNQQRRAQAALQQARDELEHRVNERTKDLATANESLRTEIGERKRTEALLDGQKRVLEMIAADAPLPESLAALMHLIEAHVPGMLGSILLIDEPGVHLCHGAAPSLPAEYMAAIDGVTISPECGSCGTAAYRKEAVIVGDIATDPLWKDYRAVALPHGLQACWSTPIFDAKHGLLGTFAMYYRQPALPQPEHLRLIELATHVAAIAICRHHSQAALRQSEAKLKEAQRIGHIGYWERDLIADRITWSKETYRIWGQPQRLDSRFGQAELEKLIYPDDRPIQRRALADAVAGVRNYDVEYRIIRPDGEKRFVHVRDEIVCDGSGRPIRMFGTVQDITECKQAEAALFQSEQRLHSLVQNAPIAIIYCDAEGFLESYNPKAAELWGRAPSIPDPKERYCGSYRIYRGDGTPIPLSANAVARVLQSGKAELNWEVIIERPDGTKVFAISNVAPLKNAQGQVTGAVACIVNITERKQAENLLRAQAQEIKDIVENSPDPIARYDRELRRTYVNPAFIKIIGVPKESLLGRSVGSTVKDGAVNATGEAVEIFHRSLKCVFDTGRPLDFETTWPLPTGRRSYAVHLEPEFDARGTLTSVLSIGRDITEHKRAEEAVRESQQLLRLVLATLPVGVAVTDRAGNFVLNNEAAKRIWGKTVVSGSERWAQSKGFWHGSGERIAPENWASVRALSQGQTSLNELIDIETHDGQKKILQNSSAPIRNAEGSIVGAVIVNEDVTERVRAEEAVKKAEDNLRFVLDATPAMVHTARPDGYLDYFNQRWLDYVGLPLEGLQGWAWMSVIHPEDIDGEVKQWRACVASGEPFEYEVRMRRADGIYRWVLHRKVAVRDERGNIVKWCGSSMDIDDRKKAERLFRDSHAQLRALSARLQSVREEEATRIAREIHDDLGQQLTGLKMDLVRAERKLEKLESSPTVNALLDTIVNATELADGMIARVQEIAANLRPEMLDKLGLSAALQYESRRFQERTGVSCEARLPETELNLPPEVSTTLFRILQECLTNIARHAQATKVEVELKQEDGWVTLRVEDNGRGITEAEIASAKSLGLLGMKERTALLGGEIAFYGGAESGTVVNVSIPRSRTLVQAKVHA